MVTKSTIIGHKEDVLTQPCNRFNSPFDRFNSPSVPRLLDPIVMVQRKCDAGGFMTSWQEPIGGITRARLAARP